MFILFLVAILTFEWLSLWFLGLLDVQVHGPGQRQQQQQQQQQQQDLGTPLEMLTRSGDVTVVPKNWGHATINVEAGLAIAFELNYEYYNTEIVDVS